MSTEPTTHHAINTTRKEVRVSAVAITTGDGSVLTVRKAKTDGFMMPGGKAEPGESPRDAALREVQEELGFSADPARLESLGTMSAAALNESGYTVIADVYLYRAATHEEAQLRALQPRAEIAELCWVNPGTDPDNAYTPDQAPLNTECIFPALVNKLA